MKVFTSKIPLYPSKIQIKEFSDLSYSFHRYNNYAVEILRDYNKSISQTELRNELSYLDKILPGKSKGFLRILSAKEKIELLFKNGKVNFKKYNPNHKSFPVRCDKNGKRESRIYSNDLKHIKIPSIDNQVKISYKWISNIIKKYGSEFLYNYLNCKKQTARVVYDGKYWYLVFTYYTEEIETKLLDKSIGIDLGIEKLVTTSDKEFIETVNNSKEVIRLENRKKKLQRIVSRKYRNNNQNKTNNIRKLEKKIYLIYRRITNIRENQLHIISKNLVDKNYKVIAFENLNIRGMLKNKYLSKSISKLGWYKLITFTKYKAECMGIQLVKINRFYPSSKLCSRCNEKNTELKLSDRIFKCKKCGLVIDRDYNASLNISKEGYRLVFSS